MNLRRINIGPRAALFFGLLCAMLIALGLVSLGQASKLDKAEQFVEGNVVPSIRLLGILDRTLVSIRANNARLRNAGEPPEVRAKAAQGVKEDRATLEKSMGELEQLIVTPEGKQILTTCSGQLIPDTTLSFSSATAGAKPSLN